MHAAVVRPLTLHPNNTETKERLIPGLRRPRLRFTRMTQNPVIILAFAARGGGGDDGDFAESPRERVRYPNTHHITGVFGPSRPNLTCFKRKKKNLVCVIHLVFWSLRLNEH
ncbi:unnamed protein product, partial [Ectocarpus sp. 12 AP-2014]